MAKELFSKAREGARGPERSFLDRNNRNVVCGHRHQHRYFTISNTGESLLTYALVNVNERWFVMPTLLPYEVKTIDIGAALVAGDDNTVTVWGGGHGSSVMISDVIPTITNTFVYPDAPLY